MITLININNIKFQILLRFSPNFSVNTIYLCFSFRLVMLAKKKNYTSDIIIWITMVSFSFFLLFILSFPLIYMFRTLKFHVYSMIGWKDYLLSLKHAWRTNEVNLTKCYWFNLINSAKPKGIYIQGIEMFYDVPRFHIRVSIIVLVLLP